MQNNKKKCNIWPIYTFLKWQFYENYTWESKVIFALKAVAGKQMPSKVEKTIWVFSRWYYTTILNWVRVMVFNSTFNNISVILWLSVILVEEIEVSGENPWPVGNYIKLYWVHITMSGFELISLMVIGTDCIGRVVYQIRSRQRRSPY
jgi:hypothetical protein